MDYVDAALKYFNDGYNCSQSVLRAFAGQNNLSDELACRIAAPFGAGYGRTGDICGAISGAMMVLGLKFGYTDPKDSQKKEQSYQISKQFVDRFLNRHCTLRCKELIGYDVSIPIELAIARQQGFFTNRCPVFVRDAVEIVIELLNRG